MTLADWIVIGMIAAAAAAAIWLSHRRKKSGKPPCSSAGCTGNCDACRGKPGGKTGRGS